MQKKIELLAPAKDAEHGRMAVEYGADAVYIGGPRFGARSAAGNPVDDIGRLAEYAHRFGARVYVALNTILYDNELAEAERIARQVSEAGADALIVQDMAYAEMDLPPIPLHASTQTFNVSPEKVRFFEQVGFSRVILERALSLNQIKDIRQTSGIELEAFVHGAICVCYSGQCYLSQAVSGRSGNRGECMQPCRWDYNLTGANFRKIAEKKHLLSVRDLNLSDHLESLIDEGVSSFKIEGRLKDATYLKNSVAWYRQKLDAILARRPEFERSSQGETTFDFTPDPEKSFTRGFTDYFLIDPRNRVGSFDTPKSVGQYIGEVRQVKKDVFIIDSNTPLSNGDGICFISADGEMTGTNINTVEGKTVCPNRMEGIAPGVKIYRNYDHSFARSLERSKTRRTIGIKAEITVSADSLTLRLDDGQNSRIEKSVDGVFEAAREEAKAEETIRQQITKTGDTIFRVDDIEIYWDTPRFVPSSALNALRRETLSELNDLRLKNHIREKRPEVTGNITYPETKLDYRANVTNRLAEQFYKKHGVETIEPGFELQQEHIGKELMHTKYCIRRELGQCLTEKACTLKEPMQLENNSHIFELRFDCGGCEMALIYKGKRK